jgi:hypothetical protein
MVEHLASIYKALGSIPSTEKGRKGGGEGGREGGFRTLLFSNTVHSRIVIVYPPCSSLHFSKL